MFDQKCYDLAKAFLDEIKEATEDQIKELAQEIQDTIEDFIENNFEE